MILLTNNAQDVDTIQIYLYIDGMLATTVIKIARLRDVSL